MMISVQEYLTTDGASPFARWFANINARAALRVRTAIARMEGGNLSNVKSVGLVSLNTGSTSAPATGSTSAGMAATS